MATLDDEFDFVATSVERAARRQREVFSDALHGAGVRNAALLRHLVLAYDVVLGHVATRRADYAVAPDDAVRRSAITELRELVWSVRDMQTNLPWLEAAADNVIDLGTTFWLERLARSTVHADAEVTVIATDQLSYATQTDPWRPMITNFGPGIPSHEPPVVVVHIPRRERKSGLLHPLIVHELGHAIDDRHDVVLNIWQVAAGRGPFGRRFTTAVTRYASAEGLAPKDAALLVARRLRAWITETFCDAIATTNLGPTYLYSFLAEVAAGTMDEAGERHPPARERIALMLDQLDTAGWGGAMASADPDLDAWIRNEVANRPRHTGIDGFLLWAAKYVKAIVQREAVKALGSRLDPSEPGLSEAVRLLETGIPPAQQASGDPIRPEVIILVCWFSALASSGGGPGALPSAADAEQLASVLPAALELCAVVDAWVHT